MSKTISKWSMKMYECQDCGHQSYIGSNHYGEIYPKCRKCGWKHPMKMGQVHKCIDPVPKGMGVPDSWVTVKLGDVAEVIAK